MVLEGQVAIVTGGGQGIGKAIALRLAAEGADIGIIDVNSKTAEATCAEIKDLNRRAVATHGRFDRRPVEAQHEAEGKEEV